MSEKPILFSGPMVRAILNGTKTMTRRCHIKPQPPEGWDVEFPGPRSTQPRFVNWEASGYDDEQRWGDGIRLPYQVDDLLWVRETWATLFEWNKWPPRDLGPGGVEIWYQTTDAGQISPDRGKWRPSIFMPKWATRLWLKVTGVRVERLQEITWQDALAEGITIPVDSEHHPLIRLTGKCPPCDYIAKDASSEQIVIGHFASLWDSLNGKKPGLAWADNLWVPVYEFERIER